LVWKMNRRRLDFEALRDGLLMTAGALKQKMYGAAVDITKAPYPPLRTIYGFIDRQNLPGVFRTFDLASPDTSTPQRHLTTVPQQALFLMNSPFVMEMARRLAAQTDTTESSDRIQAMYRRVFGRTADAEEVRLALDFLRAAAEEDRGAAPPP